MGVLKSPEQEGGSDVGIGLGHEPTFWFSAGWFWFGSTPGCVQVLLLALRSGIFPGSAQGTDQMECHGFIWETTVCKASAYPPDYHSNQYELKL